MRLCLGVLVLVAWLAMPLGAQSQSRDDALRAHGGPVRALAALPNGRLASAGFDSTIILWDLTLGQATRVLRRHETAVNALLLRPDGCLVSGGEDSQIQVWCEATSTAPSTLLGHTAAVSSVSMSSDGRMLLSGSWDRSVRVWNAQGESRILVEHAAPVTSVALAADGASALSGSQDGVLKKTSLQGAALRVLKLETSINALAIGPSGDILLACADGTVRSVDPELTAPRELAKIEGPVTSLAVSPDKKTIAAGGLRVPAILVDLATGATKTMASSVVPPVWAVAFSNDGRELYTGGGDRAVRRLDAITGAARAPTIATTPEPELASTKERGARVFRACSACHGVTAQDTNLAGPTLHQIMGRRIASLSGYEFSRPLAGMDIVWTPETIAKLFEVGPTIYTPGTKMPEQRITDPEDRAALVDWLSRVTVP